MNPYCICSALLLGAALSSESISHAQAAPKQAPIAKSAFSSETARIQLVNVPVNMMAYWLDPARQRKPLQIERNEKNGGIWANEINKLTRQPGNGNGPRDLKLPPNVEITGTIVPRNVLLVKGTKTGVEALQKLVKRIDVPLKRIEIEAQIWEIYPAKMKDLPLVFRAVAPRDEAQESINGDVFARTELAAPIGDIAPVMKHLKAWENDQDARLLTAPRVSTLDGIAVTLSSTQIRAFDIDEMQQAQPYVQDSTDAQGDNLPAPFPPNEINDNWGFGVTSVQSQTSFNVAPVLHDDLIALAFQIIVNNEITQANSILRNGQTLAIRLPSPNPSTKWTRVALVKARVISRVR